jgi:hypothetical protein
LFNWFLERRIQHCPGRICCPKATAKDSLLPRSITIDWARTFAEIFCTCGISAR